MKPIAFLLFLFTGTFLSCSLGGESQPSLYEKEAYRKMDFDNLQVGDKFYFQKFYAEDYLNGDSDNFEYLDQFLEIEILDELADNKYLFKEKIYSIKKSEDIEMETPGPTLDAEEETFYNYFQIKKDDLRIIFSDRTQSIKSNLFQKEFLYFDKFRSQETDVIGWKTSPPLDIFYGRFFTADLSIRGMSYDTLNVLIDNSRIQFDDYGFTHIYDKDNGIVRYTFYKWDGVGYGWDRIVDPF